MIVLVMALVRWLWCDRCGVMAMMTHHLSPGPNRCGPPPMESRPPGACLCTAKAFSLPPGDREEQKTRKDGFTGSA